MKNFKKTFITLSLACAFPVLAPAMAADLALEPPIVSTFDSAFDWTGGYIGTQLGYGGGYADHVLEGFDRTTSNNVDGGLFGVYTGYNYQFPNNIVIGIDTDIVWSGQGGGPDAVIFCPCAPDQPNRVSTELEWSAAVRGRVGYAVDGFMPYVSGGLAVARVHGDYDYIFAEGDINATMTGWTLGAGVDYAFAENLTFRAEYRYSDFGKVTEQPFLPAFTNTQTLRLDSHDLRIGIAVGF